MLFRFLTKEPETPLICRKKMLLSKDEITFFHQLQKALPDRLIFPKITLSSLINLDVGGDKKRDILSKQLDNHKVDFAVFSHELKLICVIDLEQSPSIISQDANAFRSLHYLDKAGIKSIRWSKNRLPTFEQMSKILVQFSTQLSSSKKKNFSRNTVNQTLSLDPKTDVNHIPKSRLKKEVSKTPDSQLHEQELTEQEHDNPFALPIKTILQITPNQFVKTSYPHIWQRICLFAPDPPHLKLYLDSLFEQNRIGKRLGLPHEAAQEVMNILNENERFLKRKDASAWNQHPINL